MMCPALLSEKCMRNCKNHPAACPYATEDPHFAHRLQTLWPGGFYVPYLMSAHAESLSLSHSIRMN